MRAGRHLKIENSMASANIVQDALHRLNIADENTKLGLIPFRLLMEVANNNDLVNKNALRIAETELRRREIPHEVSQKQARVYITQSAINDASKFYFHAYVAEKRGFLAWLQADIQALISKVEFVNGRASLKHRGLYHWFLMIDGLPRLVSMTISSERPTFSSSQIYDRKPKITGHAINRASLHLRDSYLSHYAETGEGLIDWLKALKSQCEKKLLKGQYEIVYTNTVFIFSSNYKLITIHERY